jgi:thiol-disulfide isomerase/thioredoxin
MSNTTPTLGPEPAPPPAGRSLRRALPTLIVVAVLLPVLAVGVLKVQRRVEQTDSAGFTVADQEATEAEVLVVNFWASWCGPCRVEQPELSRVARAYRGRGVKFIGINVRDSQGAAESYAEEFKIPYPSLFDQAAVSAVRLQAFALPSTFILDRDGVVAYRLTGKTTRAILSARLDKLLRQDRRWTG